jgi:hypothetical protein
MLIAENLAHPCAAGSIRVRGASRGVRGVRWCRMLPGIAKSNRLCSESWCRHGGLGPVDIHRTHIIAPTKKSTDRYDSAVFS